MNAAVAALAGIFGLAIGSFLNVVIHRVPAGESVVRPASRCPACGAHIRPRDNIPLVSWALLRGRCRDCRAPVSARYPAVELLTALVFVVLALRIGAHPALPAYLYLGGIGVALAMIDIDVRRLPDALTLPSYPVGLILLGIAAAAGAGHTPYLRAVEGMAALAAFYFAVVFAYPAGMGLGDVKLAGVLGLYTAWLGWGSFAVGAFAGFLTGGLYGGALLAARRVGRKSAIPFGPFMLLGALIGVLFGHYLAHLYTGTFVG